MPIDALEYNVGPTVESDPVDLDVSVLKTNAEKYYDEYTGIELNAEAVKPRDSKNWTSLPN